MSSISSLGSTRSLGECQGVLHAAAQATQAYLEGDKALAKKLGANGRWHAAQMARAHQTASDDIFRQRNTPSVGALTLHSWRTASAAVCRSAQLGC